MDRNLDVRILETLDRWEKTAAPLPEIPKLYRDVLLVQHKTKNSLVLSPVNKDSFLDHLKTGIPLISFDDLKIDRSRLCDLFTLILRIIENHLNLGKQDMEWLGKLASDEMLLNQTARNWYEGTDTENNTHRVDRELVATTMQAVLWPWLRIQAEALSDEVETTIWRRPGCHICGGRPDFSYLAKEDGSRWLSCFRCDSEWLFQRLECPFCGNTDQKELDCFSDDSGFYRMEVCHKCRNYIKSIDLRKAKEDVLIPLEKVMAVNLSWMDQDSFRPGWI